MAESFGVQGRGKFYEEAGAIRDVVQNHLLQVVALLAMEPPGGDDPEGIRDERAKLLKAVRAARRRQTSCAGSSAATARSPAWRPTRRSRPSRRSGCTSTTGAGPACRSSSASGKCLPVTATEVVVELKGPPAFFDVDPEHGNHYRFRLSPEVVIALGTRIKAPGRTGRTDYVELIARHDHTGDDMEPYERLLGDAARGDATLFSREDAVEEAWRIVDPILGTPRRVHEYDPGTWGPSEADAADRRHRPLGQSVGVRDLTSEQEDP